MPERLAAIKTILMRSELEIKKKALNADREDPHFQGYHRDFRSLLKCFLIHELYQAEDYKSQI